MRYTHRTGQTQYQRCPRLNYFSQHYGGRGIDSKAKPFEMLTGIYVHKGIADLLTGASVEVAVGRTLGVHQYEVVDGTLATYGCRFEQVFKEQAALIEAIIRGWALKRLPYFMSEYDVVEVEKDHSQKLVGDVWMEFKLDALLRHKATGLWSILSNKTTNSMSDSRKVAAAKTDMQGLSEVWGIEQELGIKVNGVLMEYVITGRKEIEEQADGKKWIQWTPLIRGWFNPALDEARQVAWRYDWVGEDGKGHRLPKGYSRIAAYDFEGGVEEWIKALAGDQMFPGPELGYYDPLASQFVSIEFYRNENDVEDWLEQVQHQEFRINEGLDDLEAFKGDRLATRHVLNKYFPQYHHSCNYPTQCVMHKMCWENAADEPFMNGYQWRVPHHEKELERVANLAGE